MLHRHILTGILGFLLLLGGSPGLAYAQERYATSQLRSIAEKTGITISRDNGFHYAAARWNKLPVSLAVEDGVVTHIGYALFTPWQRQHLPEAQCNFIERLLLTSDIDGFYGKTFSRHLLEEKISLDKGSLNDLRALTLDTSFFFQTSIENDKRHIWNWYVYTANTSVQRTITLSYPADANLILGATVNELEDNLPSAARRFKATFGEEQELATSLYQPVATTPLYMVSGDIFFIPELNSNRYYILDTAGRFRLTQGQGWVCEEMANMATGTELESDIALEVQLVKYGFRTETFRLPLRQWVAWCLGQGCRPYFGIMSNENGLITAELVMNNPGLGYAHVMKLTFSAETVKSGNGVAKARLNSYVPMSNVKSLFNENEK